MSEGVPRPPDEAPSEPEYNPIVNAQANPVISLSMVRWHLRPPTSCCSVFVRLSKISCTFITSTIPFSGHYACKTIVNMIKFPINEFNFS
jgi:hypothetical protein